MTSKKETLKDSDIVIKAERKDGSKFTVSAQSFSLNNYEDCKVSGHEYYVKLAISLGAKK